MGLSRTELLSNSEPGFFASHETFNREKGFLYEVLGKSFSRVHLLFLSIHDIKDLHKEEYRQTILLTLGEKIRFSCLRMNLFVCSAKERVKI